ncbi:MAG: hypothetical protein JXR83_19730 [Deltaproteobacteria bacterium]|nr:hypothetical protein [Deltaproteobacteria bacterium]
MLDFTAPRITLAELAPGHAAAATEVQLYLELSEPLPEPPALVLVNGAGDSHAFAYVAASGALGHGYAFTPTGQEAAGLYVVQATGADEAGNPLDEPQVAKVSLDFTPPAITTTRVVPELAAAGQRVLAEVELAEELASWGALTAVATTSGAASHVYDEVSSTSARLRFEHTVASGTDGHYRLELRDLIDLAGNTAPIAVVGAVEYDTTPPALVGFAQNHQSALATDTLVVSFSTTELLASDPVVTLGGLAMSQRGTAIDPYEYELALAGTGLVGMADIQVRLSDRVGNAALLVPGRIDVDAVPPELIDVVFTPPAARLNITAILTVTASEPLAASPTVQWLQPRGDPGFAYLGPSGLGHMWALEVTDAVDAGIYQVIQVTLRDVAGNVTVVDTTSMFAVFDVDNIRPQTTNLALNASDFSAQASHDRIVITFDLSETLEDGLLEVRLGDRLFNCESYQAGSPNYTCRYAVDGTEPEGLNIVSVRAMDKAGNESIASAPVRLDFTPPAVASAVVSYLPGPNNPLAQAARATIGSEIVIVAIADEEIAVASVATLTLVCGGQEIASNLAAISQTGGTATFNVQVPQLDFDGACLPSITWTDLVGNSNSAATFVGPQIEIKTSTPTLLVDQAAVRYVRSPWGNAAAEDLGGFTVPAGPYFALAPAEPLLAQAAFPASTFALTDGNLALLQVWADTAHRSLLGTTPATQDGSWPRLLLANLDAPAAYISGVDDAGNASALVLIENAEWVATPAPHAFGESPHSMQASVQTKDSMDQELLVKQRVESGVDGADGIAHLTSVEPRWRARTFSGNPAGREDYGMAYDSVRGRVVLFGGNSPGGLLQDTWEWDGQSWLDRTPAAGSPPARAYVAMAYDSSRGRVVMFGGEAAAPIFEHQDTWEWDGQNWVELRPASGSPPRERFPAMAYDSSRRRTVLLASGSTWEWDGQVWADRTPPSRDPGYRIRSGMVFDSARGVVVVFGGYRGGYSQETWEWDGTNWRQRTLAAGNPPGRLAPGMAFDSTAGRVVIFGGYSASGPTTVCKRSRNFLSASSF